MLVRVDGVECVLLDIEGTICPISFVKETLFPYALKALPGVLSSQWDSPALQPYIAAFPPEHAATPETLSAHVHDLTARDVKAPYLKSLQGYLWQTGYETGAYSTPLFGDVEPALTRWKDGGLKVAIYSSGSVKAQELLMAYVKSKDGNETRDLQGLVEGWFDTVNAGPKTEERSYEKIAGELGVAPGKILFLSDNVKEVDAAIGAGMKSLVVDRPGNTTLSREDVNHFVVVKSFAEQELQVQLLK